MLSAGKYERRRLYKQSTHIEKDLKETVKRVASKWSRKELTFFLIFAPGMNVADSYK